MVRSLEEETRDIKKLDALTIEYKRLFNQINPELRIKLELIKDQMNTIRYKYI